MISVLYVDDETALLDIGKRYLERIGDFTVDTAESAHRALEKIQSTLYDAIVSDYQMPVMDGIELLKTIRASNNSIPFIIFTGKGREEVVIDALNFGADFYLQKGGQPKAQFAELGHKIRQAVFQRRAEASIRNLERQQADIINFLPDATFAIDTEGVVIAWNRAMQEMTGVAAVEIIGKGNYEYALPFYGERRPILIDLVLQDDSVNRGKYPYIRKEQDNLISEIVIPHFNEGRGASLWFVSSPLFDTKGNVVGAIESIRDISELKQAENGLSHAKKDWETIFRAIGHAAVVLDAENRIIEANDAMLRLTGTSLDELRGKRCYEVFHAPGTARPPDGCPFEQLKRSGTMESAELEIDALGGYYHISCTPVFDATGRLEKVIHIAMDITERRRTQDELLAAYEQLAASDEELRGQFGELVQSEQRIRESEARFRDLAEALRESEAKYRSIIENMQDIFYRTDREGNLTMISPSAAAIAGYDSIEEMIGVNIARDFYLLPHEREAIMKKLQEDGSVNNHIVTLKRHDGTPYTVTASSHFYYDTNGNVLGVEGFLHDITEIVRANEALSLANRKLGLLNSITRHDILNKLTVVLGYLDLIGETNHDTETEEYLKGMQSAIYDIKSQIEFTRVYQDLGTHEPQWQDLEKILPISSLPARITFTADVQGIEIFADPMLERVFFNLLDNSLMHGECVTTIKVSCHPHKEGLTIVGEDDGIGIPAEDKERIFERWYGKNTGLGLFLSREILAITGITIRETGKPGEGARFEILVPKGMYRPGNQKENTIP
jgi:PAS domain S-box-containing protein